MNIESSQGILCGKDVLVDDGDPESGPLVQAVGSCTLPPGHVGPCIDASLADQCIGCFIQTPLVCLNCYGALCLDCRAGHICQAPPDDRLSYRSPYLRDA